MDPDDWLLPRDVPSWCFSPEEEPPAWREWFWLVVEDVISSARKVCSLLCRATLKLTILFISTVACGLIIGFFLNNETYTPSPSSSKLSPSYSENVELIPKDFDHHGNHRRTADDKNGAPYLVFPEPTLLLSRNWKFMTSPAYNDLQSQLVFHAHEPWALHVKSLTHMADRTVQEEFSKFSQCQDLWKQPSNMANEKLSLVITMLKKKRDELAALAQRMGETTYSRCSRQQTTHRNVEALSHMAFLLGLAAEEQVEKLENDIACFQSVRWRLAQSADNFHFVKNIIPSNKASSMRGRIVNDAEILRVATEFATREASEVVSFFKHHLDRAILVRYDILTEQENMSRWLENARGPCRVSKKQIDVLEKVNSLLSQGRLLSQGTGGRVQM
ncbi:unnamed protein product [Clonostachys byssicola]|uniref:Uncharacterized protein n=1 Tax=Clonostachys byssicola TaxID=160290 RepID=A0A9N9Y5A1_9HYPO|nr:unnamed protein product [Clonostachys byssicola]